MSLTPVAEFNMPPTKTSKANPKAKAAVKKRASSKAATKTAPRKKRTSAKKSPIRRRLPPAERRLLIIEAAKQVFLERGLHGARTKEIADAAGITEATLFHYFATKDELFDAAISQPLRELAGALSERGAEFASAESPDEQGRIGSAGHQAIFDSMEGLAPLLIQGVLSDKKVGEKIYAEDIYPAIQEMTKPAGMSFDVDSDTAEMIVLASLGMSFSIYMHNKLKGTEPDREKIGDLIAQLFIGGLKK